MTKERGVAGFYGVYRLIHPDRIILSIPAHDAEGSHTSAAK
jgi:hypothetical protein